MRIGILGNCQARGLAGSVRALAPEVDVTLHLLAGLNPKDPNVIDPVVDDLLSCDIVFVQALEDRRPELRPLITRVLEAHPLPIRTPMLAFRGFHPDCAHVQRDGCRVQGALGPYHSILGCAGWLEGLSERRTAALFNAFSYAALGYFEVYDEARERLTEEATAIGYDLSPLFDADTPVFMHTVNHPTAAALHAIAGQALDMARIPRSAHAPTPPDHLADGPIWPLYRDFARRSGPLNGIGDNGLLSSARPLVEAEYRALTIDQQAHGLLAFEGPDQPNGGQIRRARAFIRDFVISRD